MLKHLAALCFLLFFSSAAFAQSLHSDSGADSAASKDLTFSKVDVEASFPGGNEAWARYITKAFAESNIRWRRSDEGTCRVRFIVDKQGNVSDAEAINMKRTRLAKFAVEIIMNGPKWNPAMQNGKPVNAFREQPIILTLK